MTQENHLSYRALLNHDESFERVVQSTEDHNILHSKMTTEVAECKEDPIDDISKDVVSGYCRIIQHLLTSNNSDTINIIPEYITNICLAYYFNLEVFAGSLINKREYADDDIKHSNHTRTIGHIYGQRTRLNILYGTFIIDCDEDWYKNKIFNWYIKIEKEGNGSVAVGLQAFGEDTNDYMYNAKGQTLVSGIFDGINDEVYSEGDTLIMELNINDRSLIYYVCEESEDDGKESCAFYNMKMDGVKFKLAINLCKNSCVSLTNFSIEDED